MNTRMSNRLHRNNHGNMLIFVSLAMTVLSIGLLLAGSFAGVFFTHSRLQSSADEIALAGARKLNEFNRLGQMNDMLARCRQLVYGIDKQTNEVADFNDPLLAKLTRQLQDEALESAEILDSERHKLVQVAKQDAKEAMQSRFDQIKNGYAMSLPWIIIQAPQLVINDTGSVNGMESNAQELQGFPELAQEDKPNIKEGKPSNLYRSEMDAKLPIQNSPSFKFSPLPPAVVNDMAPARTVLPDTFKTVTGDYAPCCARVGLRINVGTGMGPKAEGDFRVVSAAVATGGGLWQ